MKKAGLLALLSTCCCSDVAAGGARGGCSHVIATSTAFLPQRELCEHKNSGSPTTSLKKETKQQLRGQAYSINMTAPDENEQGSIDPLSDAIAGMRMGTIESLGELDEYMRGSEAVVLEALDLQKRTGGEWSFGLTSGAEWDRLVLHPAKSDQGVLAAAMIFPKWDLIVDWGKQLPAELWGDIELASLALGARRGRGFAMLEPKKMFATNTWWRNQVQEPAKSNSEVVKLALKQGVIVNWEKDLPGKMGERVRQDLDTMEFAMEHRLDLFEGRVLEMEEAIGQARNRMDVD